MNHPIHARRIFVVLTAAFVWCAGLRAGLIHRYSFSDNTAKDSVGAVNGTLKGPGAKITDGQLVLKNEDFVADDKLSYLEFAAPILPKSGNSTTLAVWFTAKDIGGFARVLNFGDSEGGEGKQFIYFSPRTAEDQARFAITGGDVGAKTYIDTDRLDDGKAHLAIIVIDGTAKKLRVYVDGKEPRPAEDLLENTLDKVKPVQNWVGKSSFSADPGLSGSIDELRVYDHALSADEAAAVFKAGPNALPPAATSSPAAPAAPGNASAAKPAASSPAAGAAPAAPAQK